MHAPVVSPENRAQHADNLAKSAGWQEHTIHTTSFALKSYGSQKQGDVLAIYIEGDGLSWISSDMPSDNPTPILPMGLKIALHQQKKMSIAYLARPCQFVFNNDWQGCQSAYWTQSRFSSEVVNSMNQGVDYLKKYYHAKHLILLGYSGGGVIAALITARRTDVMKLITIAAPLDTQQWVDQKNLSPLTGSLNPADAWKKLALIPQTHWIGGRDTIVPKEVVFAYAKRFPLMQKPEIVVISSFDHACCWG